MPRILLTAFRPFNEWQQNASWLALQALTRDLPPAAEITTRLYPVDYEELRPRLASDLQGSFDLVLHVGQSAGSSVVQLEQFALNACRRAGEPKDLVRVLEANGPAAYRSALPMGDWTRRLRENGIPAALSLHAGDYLCNAAMYWSHYLLESMGRTTRVGFVHLPLDITQVVTQAKPSASLPSEVSALALRHLIEWSAEDSDSPLPLVMANPVIQGQA